MIQIQILEPNDILKPTDYCRPLYIIPSYGDCLNTRSTYSGTPCNNLKWTLVSNVLGECWWNRKCGDFLKGTTIKFEFARGDIPDSHILKDDEY